MNGDGVIPPEASEDPGTQTLIKEIIATLGGLKVRTAVVELAAASGLGLLPGGTGDGASARTATTGCCGIKTGC